MDYYKAREVAEEKKLQLEGQLRFATDARCFSS